MSRVFPAVGGCGLGGQSAVSLPQRPMDPLHLKQGQSPRGAFEEFGRVHPETERMRRPK